MPHRSRRLFASLLTAGLALPLSACAGPEAGSPGRSGATKPRAGSSLPEASPEQKAEYEAFARLGYKLTWRSAPLVSRDRRALFFDPYANALLFQDTGNIVTCLDPATGATRWSTEVDTALARFVGNVLEGDKVYSSSDNELFILDAKAGQILERHHLAVVVNTRPVISGRLAIYGSTTGEAFGHNLLSGYKLWGNSLKGAITARPALLKGEGGQGDAVAIVSQGGEVAVLDAAHGSSIGRATIFGGLVNEPVVSTDLAFVASTDQSIYAFEARGGRLRWRERTERPITDQPVARGDELFVSVPERGLVCFGAGDGSIKWTAKGVRGRVLGVRDGRLLVWDADASEAVLLDPKNGDFVDRVTLEGVWRLETDKPEDGALYSVNERGRISKFGPR